MVAFVKDSWQNNVPGFLDTAVYYFFTHAFNKPWRPGFLGPHDYGEVPALQTLPGQGPEKKADIRVYSDVKLTVQTHAGSYGTVWDRNHI